MPGSHGQKIRKLYGKSDPMSNVKIPQGKKTVRKKKTFKDLMDEKRERFADKDYVKRMDRMSDSELKADLYNRLTTGGSKTKRAVYVRIGKGKGKIKLRKGRKGVNWEKLKKRYKYL